MLNRTKALFRNHGWFAHPQPPSNPPPETPTPPPIAIPNITTTDTDTETIRFKLPDPHPKQQQPQQPDTEGNMNEEPLTIALIGSGIIGTILALGLLKRLEKANVEIKIYEQAHSHREIGAGIAFTANARKCMFMIDQRIVDCVNTVATANGDPADPNNNLQFVDGYTHHQGSGEVDEEDDMSWKTLYKLSPGPRGFEGCHRAHFLEEVVKLMPEGVLELGKRLESIQEDGEGKLEMRFGDGSVEVADAVIGCDGIKSRVREILFGADNPASYPHYTHKIAYRGLVPMDLAIAKLGEYRARNQHMYGGPNAHLLHFPVAKQQLLNVVVFVADPEDWPLDKPMSQPATKEEAAAAFLDWGPTVKAIIDLLPVEMDKWAVFDALDYPAPTYARGRICIAGDAAHASSPHHGAGAGIGVEDTLALSVLLEAVLGDIKAGRDKKVALEAAFQAFSTVRLERSQWLVRSSREVCETYEWNNPACGSDMDKGYEDVKWRSHKIWYFDIEGMLGELEHEYKSRLEVA